MIKIDENNNESKIGSTSQEEYIVKITTWNWGKGINTYIY